MHTLPIEEEILKEAWARMDDDFRLAWMDDDFKLDTDSPLGISRSLWDDFTSCEAVVRSLFPSNPAPHAKDLAPPAFCFEKPESPERSSSWEIMPDCSPSPLKRRCMLQFGDEDLTNMTPSASGLLENDGEYIVGAGEGSRVHGSSLSNSLCCIATEESHSSVDDAVEQSAESWMVGCLSDSDASDVQEIPPPLSVDSPISATASKTSLARATGTASKNRRIHGNAASKLACPVSHSKQSKDIPGQIRIERRAHVIASQSGHAKESARPVLAYPFALVKPSGIQGDVTLQDINQRIKMVPSAPRCGSNDSYCTPLASPLSGKSVVALTKIQTEGKGTITILRTRS